MRILNLKEVRLFCKVTKDGLKKHEWPTEEHKQSYMKYERVLWVRAHLGNLTHFVNQSF